MDYYSALKKTGITPFAETWMDLEIIILSEVARQKIQISYDITYVNSKKQIIQVILFTKQKQTHGLQKYIYGY